MWFALFVLVVAMLVSWNLFDRVFVGPEDETAEEKESLKGADWLIIFKAIFIDSAYNILELFFLPICAGQALLAGYGPSAVSYVIFLIWLVHLAMYFDLFGFGKSDIEMDPTMEPEEFLKRAEEHAKIVGERWWFKWGEKITYSIEAAFLWTLFVFVLQRWSSS